MARLEPDALRARRDALSGQLHQGLLDDAPLPELQAHQARLKLLDEQLAARDAGRVGRQRLQRQGVGLLAVGALVSLAAWVPVRQVPFSLELEAGAAQLVLAQPGVLDGLPLAGGELRAEGFTSVESGDAKLMQRARADGASPLALRAERLQLSRVSFGAGTVLHVEAGMPAVRLGLEGAAHAVALEVGGATSSGFGGEPAQPGDYPVAEWLKLGGSKAATSLWLPRSGDGTYHWRGLQPAALRFIEREAAPDGQVRLVSALLRGTLRLPATERELALAAGSGLMLEGLQVEQCDLTLGSTVGLKLSGSARQIGVQTGGFEQSLVPSWLEYAAHNHRLGLLWSAAGLLWGIGTWLRKQFGDAA
ncbi:hypothetical protein [Pelomonas cellulosilytica]|uniref:Uncharacterized protein n=1 Tax=Pelomonas cellulosilytica TaxID=2906762 RepID=A0ABS8XSZ1_9BURK|nr:hypothetical protein [Pelomonas sp. P8]MCE4553843.1 hypothetical protein [Pelomonas sp. P8]